MKDFTPIKIPQAERLEVNSREGKLLNKAFWAAIALVVKQINSMMEGLLANINPNFPLWGRCEEHDIRANDGVLVAEDVARLVWVTHRLGVVPSRWIPCGTYYEVGTAQDPNALPSLAYSIIAGPKWMWSSTRVPFYVSLTTQVVYKILLLP